MPPAELGDPVALRIPIDHGPNPALGLVPIDAVVEVLPWCERVVIESLLGIGD